jgi:hypothetical protein
VTARHVTENTQRLLSDLFAHIVHVVFDVRAAHERDHE